MCDAFFCTNCAFENWFQIEPHFRTHNHLPYFTMSQDIDDFPTLSNVAEVFGNLEDASPTEEVSWKDWNSLADLMLCPIREKERTLVFAYGDIADVSKRVPRNINVKTLFPISRFEGVNIVKCISNTNLMYFLSKDGEVYVQAKNPITSGLAPVGTETQVDIFYAPTPTKNKSFTGKITQVVSSPTTSVADPIHNLALSEMGFVYQWGVSKHALDSPEISPPLVLKPLQRQKVIQIVCRMGISAVLCEDGKVYHWGHFSHSFGHLESIPVELVIPDERVIQIALGGRFNHRGK